MKVLEIINWLGPTGGGETFGVNLSRELQEIAELKVVILRDNNKDYFLKRLEEKGISPIVLRKEKHLDLANAKELRSIIEAFQPDVIHTENNALIQTYLALRHTKQKKTKVFHTMHQVPEDECANRIIRILYRHIFKKKNYVPVAITESLAEKSALFYKQKTVPCIRNGIDLEPLHSDISFLKRSYDIVVVGRFAKIKNHGFLLHAFAKIKEVVPTLKVALVGGGELFEETKALSKSLGLEENVDFIGVVDHPASIVGNAKIIALGSTYEANPLSLLEGMTLGCVVVSSSVGGVPDIIHEPENGFLFPCNDENRFVSIVTNILANPKAFESVANGNKEYAQQFSMKECAKNYLSLFQTFSK